MKTCYHKERFPEDGASYPIRVFFMKDIATIGIDTSGVSLHKRGYRQLSSNAPITETLAAALILLSPWKKDRILVDPFCGSGTFPIEAAMMAANIAPGLNREFSAERGRRSASSEKIRIYHYQPSLWGKAGGPAVSAADLPGFWGKLPPSV